MKSLFITLPQRKTPDTNPPYGALAVMNALRKNGFPDTSLYNIDSLRPGKKQSIEYIKNSQPDVLCITAPVSTAYKNCKDYSQKIKKLLPNTTIVVGGNMTASAEVLLKKTDIDFCVLGEGEVACCELFEVLSQKKPRTDLYHIKGLAFLDNGRLISTGYADPIPADKIYDINWDDIDPVTIKNFYYQLKEHDLEKNFYPREDKNADENVKIIKNYNSEKIHGIVKSAKGCVGRCTFCHRFTKGMRYIPTDLVIENIKLLQKRFHLDTITFADECFGANKKELKELCAKIKPLNLLWRVSGMRVDMVDAEIIHMMKDAGCRNIDYGLESGSEKMLKVMEKRVTVEKNYQAIKHTVGAGLYSAIQLVIGMPGETTETIEETARFCAKCLTISPHQNPLHISINFAQALPGTPLYEYARCIGLIGTSVEDEEQYLIEVSNRNAADSATTLNFTDLPKLIQYSWPYVILSIINYTYVKHFGIKHFYDVVFNGKKAPSIFLTIKNRKVTLFISKYPIAAYHLRKCMWLIAFALLIKKTGFIFSFKLLGELITQTITSPFRKKRTFHYKSLRKILEEDFNNPYSGIPDMVPLRKGQ